MKHDNLKPGELIRIVNKKPGFLGDSSGVIVAPDLSDTASGNPALLKPNEVVCYLSHSHFMNYETGDQYLHMEVIHKNKKQVVFCHYSVEITDMNQRVIKL